jgi:GT2 family glycosyltransferase
MKTLSIIICTYNRAQALPSCLDAVVRSLEHAGRMDANIILIDNACTDNTPAVIQTWHEAHPDISVRLLHEPRQGLAHARNCALRAVGSDLLMFTDDDCHLSLDYVKQALAYDAADTTLTIRGGAIERGDPTDLILTIKTDPYPERWQRGAASAVYRLIGGQAISGANMVMRREVVEKVGFFDTRLGAGTMIPGGEDTDYYLRAYFAGITIAYVPDMAVVHYHGRKSVEAAQKLMANYLLSQGALYAKHGMCHPALLRELYWDCKKAWAEWRSKQNSFIPEWDISCRDKLRYHARGAWLFMTGARA